MIIGYVLLALGIAAFVLSFVIPAKTEQEKTVELSEDMIREMVSKEVENAKAQITDVVDETITYAMEKSERSMDRLTNEKIMAVNEYSDTVLSDIDKSHKEVVFLHDMLNDKQEKIKTTVADAEKTASEVKQAVKDAELSVKDAKEEAAGLAKKAAEDAVAGMNAVREGASVVSEPEMSGGDILAAMKDWESLSGDSGQEKTVSAGGSEGISAVSPSAQGSGALPGNGRMSAIDRLKAAKAAEDEEFKSIIFEQVSPEEAERKKPKKKKNTKRTVREEAVVLGEGEEGSLSENGLELIRNDPENELMNYVAGKQKEEVPDIHLGENLVGTGGGRNNNEKILELHNAGKSNMAIAKELGLGIGEVKLVIDLFEGM
ncbi:MAG: hypothetical protein K6F53_12730 [Lachnospiraceae bacterium]|nr:hypothetical protein [Lachnospiraceae bacterium]